MKKNLKLLVCWLVLFQSATAIGCNDNQNSNKPNVEFDLRNSKYIVVDGWTKNEMQQITIDFMDIYGEPAFELSDFSVKKAGTSRYKLEFPKSVDGKIFVFFINYIRYPNGFELKSRSIGVVGFSEVADLGGDDESVNAVFYVPSADELYDVVYASTVRGKTYSIELADGSWSSQLEPRLGESEKRILRYAQFCEFWDTDTKKN